MFGSKKIKIQKNGKTEILTAKVIKEPSKTLSKDEQAKLVSELKNLIKKSWGEIDEQYIIENLINSFFVLILESDGNKMGLSVISKRKLKKKGIYYFEITLLDPDFRSLGLAEKMNLILIKKILLLNFLKPVELMFITANPRVLEVASKFASFLYPNPYLFNMKTKKIPNPDKETWEMAKELIKVVDNMETKITKNGCLLTGFYQNHPQLVQDFKEVKARDKIVNDFFLKYIGKKTKKEFVCRMQLSGKSLITNV